ncbi:hypothetical protein GGR56DRAFT_533678 [Xylariaceae sp. FL0804]|nr:hypothetical protein GGR56DRAFT_533678 [Xylariaceae sp. FL0804]
MLLSPTCVVGRNSSELTSLREGMDMNPMSRHPPHQNSPARLHAMTRIPNLPCEVFIIIAEALSELAKEEGRRSYAYGDIRRPSRTCTHCWGSGRGRISPGDRPPRPENAPRRRCLPVDDHQYVLRAWQSRANSAKPRAIPCRCSLRYRYALVFPPGVVPRNLNELTSASRSDGGDRYGAVRCQPQRGLGAQNNQRGLGAQNNRRQLLVDLQQLRLSGEAYRHHQLHPLNIPSTNLSQNRDFQQQRNPKGRRDRTAHG